MSAFGKKMRLCEGEMYIHQCPGCKGAHGIPTGVGPGPRWSFNGDAEAPSFSPSVKISTTRPEDYNDPNNDRMVEYVLCHYFITNGMIQFCGDCEHELAGQTVPLPDFNP